MQNLNFRIRATSMLVTDNEDKMCFGRFCHQHSQYFSISVGYQHPTDVTNIKILSLTSKICHQDKDIKFEILGLWPWVFKSSGCLNTFAISWFLQSWIFMNSKQYRLELETIGNTKHKLETYKLDSKHRFETFYGSGYNVYDPFLR